MHKSWCFKVRSYDRDADQWREHERSLIVEIPLLIMVNGEYLATLNRTPGDDFLLASGFLYYQGLIDGPEDILNHQLNPAEKELSGAARTSDTIHFTIKKPTPNLRPQSAAALWSKLRPYLKKNRRQPFTLAPQLITGLPDEMIKEQELYKSTAGAHAVALIGQDGRILHCAEDVGRTNALDKVVGHCVSKQINMSDCGALFSGRINLEMAVKIARAGFPLIFSVSAPTAAAVAVLKELGVTYTGSLKGKSFTLFNGSL